jgi:hypothetical protein
VAGIGKDFHLEFTEKELNCEHNIVELLETGLKHSIDINSKLVALYRSND